MPRADPFASDRARLGAGLVVAAARLAPRHTVVGGPIFCPIRRLTGRPCPSCGLTRSVVLTAHGDLADAVRFHRFGPLALVGLGWVAAGRPGADSVPRPVWRTTVALLGAAWVWYGVGRAVRRVGG